eukprot:CAMPEP_0194736996 /NCGR_PEP_ID=MMETSP0296-20130528/79443_1 /TAXON_ID=39354 /ORGANISM="Heterosigma akashiwo, Strain CCMP2393" /LENGTH=106 /DNA_ID=CAMNT_0039646773 /DNA_START=103 /DNA_END=424 /DNA_ORIENTATION=+
MVGNMVEDHGSGKYFSALFEVRDVRAAREAPPAWVPFDATDRCQVCAAEFTWASTSSSDAQANRDKHNCNVAEAWFVILAPKQNGAFPSLDFMTLHGYVINATSLD